MADPPNHRPPTPTFSPGDWLGAFLEHATPRSIGAFFWEPTLFTSLVEMPSFALGKHVQNDQNYGKMMVRCCKMWWIFRWNSQENHFLEWPELAKEPRNQLGSCIFVFISWSASRSLHPKPRCWKICDFVWIVPCLHKTQLYPNMNYYDMLCISLYLTISHCIFLTCRSYTPNKHPNSRISGTPEPQPVFSLSVHDEPGWLIWINWNQNWILTGA